MEFSATGSQKMARIKEMGLLQGKSPRLACKRAEWHMWEKHSPGRGARSILITTPRKRPDSARAQVTI